MPAEHAMHTRPVLMMASTYPRHEGDAEPRFIADLAMQLVKQGIEVHVLVPHAKGLPLHEVMDGVSVYRFVYALPALESLAYEGGILSRLKAARWRYLLVPFFLLAQLAWVLVLHGRFRYRLLHAHWLVPQGVVAVLCKRLLFWQRLPVLLTSHGGDLFALQGGILNRLKGWVIRHADALTVVSEAMRQHVVAHWPALDVQVLPMGVDFEQRFVVDDSRPRNSIIYVGRLVEKKGVHVLLDAFALLAARRLECPQLVIVGDGPDRPMLQSRCHALGLGERVLFMGALPQTRLAGVYARAILAVMPSVVARDGDQEGLGLVAVEAMGCGVPVLASDLPAVRDAVIDGQTGRLFPAGDHEALAALMATLLDDPDARDRLTVQARQHAVSRFGWANVAGAYAGIYEDLG